MARSLRLVWEYLENAFKKIFPRSRSSIAALPTNIDSGESVGRGVFDTKKAKHARAGKIQPRIFRERNGIGELSVDRLSYGNHTQIGALHDRERSPQRLFGWAQLSTEDARKNGRSVVARPIIPNNPYHAEIVLPQVDPSEMTEEQDQHALNLAMLSTWLPRPSKS